MHPHVHSACLWVHVYLLGITRLTRSETWASGLGGDESLERDRYSHLASQKSPFPPPPTEVQYATAFFGLDFYSLKVNEEQSMVDLIEIRRA